MTTRGIRSLPLALALCLAGLTACDDEAPRDSSAKAVAAGPALKFSAGARGLPEMLNALDVAMRRAGLPKISVIVELKLFYSTKDIFKPASSYSSLAAFAADMEAQDPTFKWSIAASGALFVRPAVGALLDKPLSTSKTYTAIHPCAFLEAVNLDAEPTKTGIGGCESRGSPRSLPESVVMAYDTWSVATKTVAGETVLDAVDRMITDFGHPMGFTVYAFKPGLHSLWRLR